MKINLKIWAHKWLRKLLVKLIQVYNNHCNYTCQLVKEGVKYVTGTDPMDVKGNIVCRRHSERKSCCICEKRDSDELLVGTILQKDKIGTMIAKAMQK